MFSDQLIVNRILSQDADIVQDLQAMIHGRGSPRNRHGLTRLYGFVGCCDRGRRMAAVRCFGGTAPGTASVHIGVRQTSHFLRTKNQATYRALSPIAPTWLCTGGSLVRDRNSLVVCYPYLFFPAEAASRTGLAYTAFSLTGRSGENCLREGTVQAFRIFYSKYQINRVTLTELVMHGVDLYRVRARIRQHIREDRNLRIRGIRHYR